MPTCKICSTHYKQTAFTDPVTCPDCEAVILDEYEEELRLTTKRYSLQDGKTQAVFSEDRDMDYIKGIQGFDNLD